MPDQFLGAIRRDYDPASDAYHLMKTIPVTKVDFSVPYSITKYRSKTRDQKRMGSCAAVSSGAAAEAAHRVAMEAAGITVDDTVQFNYTWIYYHARLMQNFFGSPPGTDTGSQPEDCLKLLSDGAPWQTGVFPNLYLDDPKFVPPAEVENAPRADYVLNFRPFYPKDGPEAMALAFQNKMSVVMAMDWPEEFMQLGGKGNCLTPAGVPRTSSVGGHAFNAVKLYPNADAVGCPNQWSSSWTQASQFDPELNDGDFILRNEYVWGPTPRVWAMFAVTFQPLSPVPPPDNDTRTKLLQAATDVVNEYARLESITKGFSRLYNKYRKEGAGDVLQRMKEVQ